jgi:small subunit ribosomal protein S1
MVKGKIVRHAPFGVFVEIEEGIEGLCHVSEFEDPDGKGKPEDRFPVGEVVEFRIIKMTPSERKIGLSQRAVSEEGEHGDYGSYRDSADGSATLADLFHGKDNG